MSTLYVNEIQPFNSSSVNIPSLELSNITASSGGFTTVSASSWITGSDVWIEGWGSVSASLVSAGGGGGSTDTGSLLTTASSVDNVITFTKGDASTFTVTVSTGSVVSASFASTASYVETAQTASYVLNAVSASYAVTASHALNGGGGSVDTGSFFISASSYGPSGSVIFTQGDGGTQIVTVGSSLVSALLPNSEIIVSPTQSYGLIGTYTTDTFPEFKSLNPQNFQYSWGTAAQPTGSAILIFRDDTNSEWGNVGAGNYIAFNSFGSSNLSAYYEVNSALYDSSSYGLIRYFSVTAVDLDNQFSATNSASFQGSVSIPNAAYPSRISLGKYPLFTPANSLSTNYTNGTILVSGSTPSGSWLFFGSSPISGSAFSAQSGYYIGLGSTTSSFTYYVVNGESYTNAALDYFIGITPVAGEYIAAPYSDVYIESARWIPAQPYYNNLSHITYPITPSGTSDATGSIGDVSYDDNYFYVKTSAGWKRASLSTW